MPPEDTTAPLSADDFAFVRKLVLDQSAIVINADQGYLVETRLGTVAKREGFPTVGRLLGAVRAAGGGPLQVRVVEAMTTNETSFFRDHHPFEALRTHILPELIRKRAGAQRLSIWCGACSTGQEPYSVAMLLKENFPQLASWKVDILATDLSLSILERAKAGLFTQLEVNRGLPANLLVKYFSKVNGEWQLSPAVRAAVRFEPFNLTAPWRPLPAMDLILMRNVLIYFDVGVKKQILARARGVLQKDGFLLLGGAETTFNLDDAFERAEFGRFACYRVRGAAAAAPPPLAAAPVAVGLKRA